MQAKALSVHGAYLLQHQPSLDRRGWFVRLHCEDELREMGLVTSFVQSNASLTAQDQTVRGLHFQKNPQSETKIVNCLQGEVFDVIADLRKDSPTFGHSASIILKGGDGVSVYIPAGCAHGFQTLSENVVLTYLMSNRYDPASATGIHWLDKKLNINWPVRDPKQVIISAHDAALPNLEEVES